ncbi:phosphoribosylanthranilate isomerase [Pseudohongiella sp.]|uniref:phosphoribosylanthranilate isomerase n=1 Tax=marine sediment metagenome TaxID=412755 RepID=A0A0F9WGW6_9ZZZZ|nr:phosphoribosylanthranilate isomerase [Pseudohongiella sp.]
MQRRTRVKICGITRPEDARLASQLGADALGLVFYAGSPRGVDLQQAQAIRAAVPAFVSLVGLFVNPERKQVDDVLACLRLDCLQFHGEEEPDFCQSFAMPYMKAVRVRSGTDPMVAMKAHRQASAILLDSYDPEQAGGTGKRFDWTVARHCVDRSPLPIVLAGGLTQDNAARAIKEVHPWALDLSSGVEKEPGIKDPQRLQAFFNEVNRVRI